MRSLQKGIMHLKKSLQKAVIPLKKGIHVFSNYMRRIMEWIPAFAGMTHGAFRDFCSEILKNGI